MPQITVDGFGSYDVPEGQRLVHALEANGVDILHRCGGFARCTTCRVEFHDGEPDQMTEAERERLDAQNLTGQVRLSCQILTNQDMTVKPVYLLSDSDLDDPGSEPEVNITPDPVWIEAPGTS